MAQLLVPAALDDATVVCGCGGGAAVRDVLPTVLHHARRLVLDADGLNTVAGDAGLTRALRARAARSLATVLTPHPLEAARLLNTGSRDVQGGSPARAQTNWPTRCSAPCCSRARAASSPRRDTPRRSTRPATRAWARQAAATCWPAGSAACGRRTPQRLAPTRGSGGRVAARRRRRARAARRAVARVALDRGDRVGARRAPGDALASSVGQVAFARCEIVNRAGCARGCPWSRSSCQLGRGLALAARARPFLAARSRARTAASSACGDRASALRPRASRRSPSSLRTMRKSMRRLSRSTRLTCTRTRVPAA